MIASLLLLGGLAHAACAGLDDARARIAVFVPDPAQVDLLVVQLQKVGDDTATALRGIGPTDGIADRLCVAVRENLAEKALLPGGPLPMSARDISRTVIDYEAFKLQTYVTAGVFPKRYFGYLDGKASTAPYEAKLERTARAAATELNAWEARKGSKLRVTEAEITVTFLAEGGALMLGDRPDLLTGLHPVMDVGLDNFASGLADLPDLRAKLDHAAGTDLASLVAWVSPQATALSVPSKVPANLRYLQGKGANDTVPYLTRLMSFEEGVVGTALMYVWEKEIAERKLEENGWDPLWTRDLDDQFILSSLVYNSGLIFSPDRWRSIRTLSSGPWLAERSLANAATRPRLNLLSPPELLSELNEGGGYRDQPTSWMGAYHILQRYGAFTALFRFTDVFNVDGSFRALLPG